MSVVMMATLDVSETSGGSVVMVGIKVVKVVLSAVIQYSCV